MSYRLNPLRFLAWFVGLTIGLPLLLMAINAAVGVDLDSSAISVIPMFIAAMQEGTAFAKAEKRRPEGNEAWKIAGQMTLLAVVASVVLAVVQWFLLPEMAMVFAQLDGSSWTMVAGFVVLFIGFLFVVARFFFGLGARNQMKIEGKTG